MARAAREPEKVSEALKNLTKANKEQEEQQRLEEERVLKGLKLSPPASSKTQALKKHLDDLANKDGEMFARLVKAWIHEDDQ